MFVQLKKEYDRCFQNLVLDILNDESVWSAEHEERLSAHAETKGARDELEWILENLKYIQYNVKTDWSETDKANIKQLAEQLMMDSKVSTTTLKIGNQPVGLPVIGNESLAEMILKDATSSKVLPELSVDDINDVISNTRAVVPKCNNDVSLLKLNSSEGLKRGIESTIFLRPKAPPHLTFHDYIINSSTYHSESGAEKCCELDSPSCILTAALVSDRLESQNNHS